MFRCTWLYTPRERALATRLYARAYGRTYGRRPVETEQPSAMPQSLQLREAPSAIASASDEVAAANSVSRAA